MDGYFALKWMAILDFQEHTGHFPTMSENIEQEDGYIFGYMSKGLSPCQYMLKNRASSFDLSLPGNRGHCRKSLISLSLYLHKLVPINN